MDKSEESTVFSRESWRNEFNCNLNFLTRVDGSFDWLRSTTKIISVSLNEHNIFWPDILSIISESPCLDNDFTRSNLESVSKVFLDKSSAVDDLLLFWSLLPFLLTLSRRSRSIKTGSHLTSVKFLILVLILALDKSWGLVRSSDFKHWVLMLVLYFTLLTEVEVRADTALVSDTLNRICLATITGYSVVDLSSLICSSLSKVIYHKSLESLGGVRFNLILENFH